MMAAADKINDAAKVVDEVSDALFLSQAILIRVSNFLQGLGQDFESYGKRPQRSR
jgi:hypothetical protein